MPLHQLIRHCVIYICIKALFVSEYVKILRKQQGRQWLFDLRHTDVSIPTTTDLETDEPDGLLSDQWSVLSAI